VIPARPDWSPDVDALERRARAAMAYALIWPACAVAFVMSVITPSASSGIVLYLVLAPIGLVGAIAAIHAARETRLRSPHRLRLALAAETIGWIEIVFSVIVFIWVVTQFAMMLDSDHL
jgi:hypothetical protein